MISCFDSTLQVQTNIQRYGDSLHDLWFKGLLFVLCNGCMLKASEHLLLTIGIEHHTEAS